MHHLLLVEDSAVLRRRYFRELSNKYRVTTSSNFEDAKRFLRLDQFDILLSDLHLSDADEPEGIALIDLARRRFPKLLINAMSSDAGLEEKALEAGADRFLSKPIDLSKVFSSNC